MYLLLVQKGNFLRVKANFPWISFRNKTHFGLYLLKSSVVIIPASLLCLDIALPLHFFENKVNDTMTLIVWTYLA